MNIQVVTSQDKLPFPVRYCDLYISDKYKQILFVPYGKIDIGINAEVDRVIADSWPCKFQDLQANIEEALNRYLPATTYIKGKWPSYDHSKAKTQKSFELDYLRIRLATDLSREYGEREVERIRVTAQPTPLDTTYQLVGTGHLIDTKIAQIVIDIYEACMKIRGI